MATTGYISNYLATVGGAGISISWTQLNFNPQNETFDITYDIQAVYTPYTSIYRARDFKLHFKYSIDSETIFVINSKNISVTSSWASVAYGTITIKASKLSSLYIPWNVDCLLTYQLGTEVIGNINWGSYYESKLDHSFQLDGFKSPIIQNILSDIILYENNSGTGIFKIQQTYPDLKYSITVNFKDYSETILSNEILENEQIEYTPPISWLHLMPDEIKSSASITIISHNSNGNQIGYSTTATFNIMIDDSVKPKIENFMLGKISESVPQNWNMLIQGLSKANVKINSLPGKGATISKHSILSSLGDMSDSNEITTNVISTSGILSFTAYVVDSRGRRSEIKTFNTEVEPYNKPIITEYLAKRCNSHAEYMDDGKYIVAKLNGSYSSCSGKNSITDLRIKVEKNIDGSIVCNDSILADTETILSGQYDSEHSYTVTFSITDYFFTSQISLLVPTSKATLDLLKGGKGIAFGKVAETEGFECEYNAKFNNNIYIIIDGLQKELRNVLKELNDTKISLDKIVSSSNITENGYLMDGKTLSDELFNIKQNIAQLNSITQLQE